MAEPDVNTGLSGSKAHVLCTRPHCICSDCQSALRKSSCFASSLIRDYADETGPYQGLKERQRSKSILLKILNGKKERKKEKTSILSHLYFSVLPHAPVLFLN